MLRKKMLSLVLTAGLVLPILPPGDGGAAIAARARETKEIVIEKDVAGNPIVTKDDKGKLFYGGDPSVLVDGDTVYAYVGHDESTDSEVDRRIYNMKEYCCYSTKDMKTWKWEGPVMQVSMEKVSWVSTSTTAWASQVAKYKDKYYLYFCSWDKTSAGKQSIGVAVADRPTGPFVDIGKPLVKGTITSPQSSDWDDIDPTIWIEKDKAGKEHRYLAWGNSRYYICELNEDMISVKDLNGDGKITCGTSPDKADIINRTPSDYTEAPWLYRRTDEKGEYTGPYYLFYASKWREKMAYSTTEDLISGQFTFGKTLMPPTATSNTNHMAVFDFKGKTYFMYHNGSQPAGNGYRRTACITELQFNEDGSIREIAETASGLSGTTSVLYTNSGKLLEHEYFENSISDSAYPYTDKKIGVGIGKEKTDSEWLLMEGKAEAKDSYISIQSENKPGLYITAQSKTKVSLAQDTDATAQTAKRQTFKTVQGLAGEKGISFESVAYPGNYLTMVNSRLTLTDGTDAEGATFYRTIDKEDNSLRSVAASIKNNEVLQGNADAIPNLKENISFTAAYADGTAKTVTGFTIDVSSVNVKKTGTQMLALEYSEGDIKKTTVVPVVVIVKPLPVKKLTVKTTVKKKKVRIKFAWKKAAGERYELSYGAKKSRHKKLGTVKAGAKTKTYTRSVKTIKKGKKYYFHIRTYSTVNGKKKYSKFKTVKVKVK